MNFKIPTNFKNKIRLVSLDVFYKLYHAQNYMHN